MNILRKAWRQIYRLWHRIEDTGFKGFVLGLELLYPLFGLRILRLRDDRIGHLVGYGELLLRREAVGEPLGPTLIIAGKHVANEQAMRMFARRRKVLRSDWLCKIHDRVLGPRKESLVRFPHPSFTTETRRIWNQAPPQTTFTQQELAKGRLSLEKMGVNPDAPWVCFAVRDAAYLRVADPRSIHPGVDYHAYHNYRDADPNDVFKAVDWISDQGYQVIRMGAAVEGPLGFDNPKIVDYATNFRTEFDDIYLLAHCHFMLGDSSGIYLPAAAANRPVVNINMAPLASIGLGKNSLFLPKLYRTVGSDTLIPFSTVVESGAVDFTRTEEYERSGIELVNNTAEEILEVVQEMEARLTGDWVPAPADEERLKAFRSVFPKSHPSHGFLSRVGAKFLERHQNLLP